MKDPFPLTHLQVEWLRRCAVFAPDAAPRDIVEALAAAGFVEVKVDGKQAVSPSGRMFLEYHGMQVRRGRVVRDSRTHNMPKRKL